MNRKASFKILPGIMLGVALAGPAFAQSASNSMHRAVQSTENAASHAWNGTKTAVKDTDITAKVKLGLHNDKLTKGQDIHVDTYGGVVTLSGNAPHEVASRATRIAQDTTGVVSVTDAIRSDRPISAR